MDKERQIRFLYPPFLLIASLLLGLYFDPYMGISNFLPSPDSELTTSDIVAILVGGGLLILVIGFLIGTLTVNLLRLGFLLFGQRHYEVVLPDIAYDGIREIILGPGVELYRGERFYAAVTFDHEILPDGVHQWIVRRWNAFYVSTNSFVAIALSLLIGYFLNIQLTRHWVILTAIASILFLINGIIAWRETMHMLEFQSRRRSIPRVNQRPSDESEKLDNTS